MPTEPVLAIVTYRTLPDRLPAYDRVERSAHYCADCLELTRMNWTGEVDVKTLRIVGSMSEGHCDGCDMDIKPGEPPVEIPAEFFPAKPFCDACGFQHSDIRETCRARP